MATTYRDTHAGLLRAADAGRTVRLAGWVARRRDHGGVVFVDLRDASGRAQVVGNPEEQPELAEVLHGLRAEYCIAVTGTVRLRPDGTTNPDLATGEIEVVAERLDVLSAAAALPFQLDERTDVDESRRLQYRYLDLRRPRMRDNLVARSRVVATMRRTMDDLGFLEVETPTLIASTPEGARDFLVPSRLRPGEFYALPAVPPAVQAAADDRRGGALLPGGPLLPRRGLPRRPPDRVHPARLRGRRSGARTRSSPPSSRWSPPWWQRCAANDR